MNLYKLSVELLTCPTCNALPGQPCRSKSGQKLTDHGHPCHGSRTQPLHEVWGDGYNIADELAEAWRKRYHSARDELAKVRAGVLAALEGGR